MPSLPATRHHPFGVPVPRGWLMMVRVAIIFVIAIEFAGFHLFATCQELGFQMSTRPQRGRRD
ncbi:MAG TPA: hypothetical protein VGI49_17255 [Mycobacterium sp.]